MLQTTTNQITKTQIEQRIKSLILKLSDKTDINMENIDIYCYYYLRSDTLSVTITHLRTLGYKRSLSDPVIYKEEFNTKGLNSTIINTYADEAIDAIKKYVTTK